MEQKEKMAKRKENRTKHSIPPEKYFMLCSGTAIKSIEELALMLDKITDEDFSFHVNEEKNDFANWIKDVFGNKELADCIYPLKDKKESQIALLKHTVSKNINQKG
jgi:hypothetical protein